MSTRMVRQAHHERFIKPSFCIDVFVIEGQQNQNGLIILELFRL